MKKIYLFSLVIAMSFVIGCKKQIKIEMEPISDGYNIVFLHHSTGENIWNGNALGRNMDGKKVSVPWLMTEYNSSNHTNYYIREQVFPKGNPYGWNNYPYDYYNIWIRNAGEEPYQDEPTLEMLTKQYDMIVWKHCFPVSEILEGDSVGDVNSSVKTIANYLLQYDTLKWKMHQFPNTRFLVWTGAALTENTSNTEQAERAARFFDWVKHEWDEPGDNIFLWDFYDLETDGTMYMKEEYAYNPNDPHPNQEFSSMAAQLFVQRIVDVIEHQGEKTNLDGKLK